MRTYFICERFRCSLYDIRFSWDSSCFWIIWSIMLIKTSYCSDCFLAHKIGLFGLVLPIGIAFKVFKIFSKESVLQTFTTFIQFPTFLNVAIVTFSSERKSIRAIKADVSMPVILPFCQVGASIDLFVLIVTK